MNPQSPDHTFPAENSEDTAPARDRTVSYLSIVATSAVGFVCFLAATGISNLVRGFIISDRPDLILPASTAFVFAHIPMIRNGAYAIPFVVLLAGLASVRGAPDSHQAMRRALIISTCCSVFSSMFLLAVLLCVVRALIGGIIIQVPQ